jgi:hypothetical protein
MDADIDKSIEGQWIEGCIDFRTENLNLNPYPLLLVTAFRSTLL